MRTIRISLAQINPTVGDLTGNRDKIIDYIGRARRLGADVVVFTELAVTGYPPEDLLLKPQFVKDNLRTLKQITRQTRGITAIVGFVDSNERITDAAAIMHNGKLVYVYHKILLPNYGVFDEYRYFKPGKRFPVITVKGVNIGVNVCEDIWFADGPARTQCSRGRRGHHHDQRLALSQGQGQRAPADARPARAGEQGPHRLHQYGRRTG